MSDDQRQAVELHHLKGQPLAEVSRRMGRSKASVAGLLRRGLKELRNRMQSERQGSR
jgi:RNA polymerase sigma-70 factor (ECF subfamily)